MSERGWLIEHSGDYPGIIDLRVISWLCVKLKYNGGGARDFGFTNDASDALRFSRKEDAEAVMAMYLGAAPPDWYRKPLSVTEHEWPDALSHQPVGSVTPPDADALGAPFGPGSTPSGQSPSVSVLRTPIPRADPLPSAEAVVRDLLWREHPECCGRPVAGAEYMGQQEQVCCGCPEPAFLNDAQIVASLREHFKE